MNRLSRSLLLINLCLFQLVNAQPAEIRGVWLTNVDSQVFESREQIAEAMQFLADHNFNVVFPVVWNDARTLYPSAIMEKIFNHPLNDDFEGRDPLKEVIEEAHRRNIAVIPWFEYGFATSHKKDGGMILAKKPYWAAQDRSGNLLTKNGFEWMNAYHPEVQQFIMDLVVEVVQNYDIDGVQGDDRLPAQPIEGGYSGYTVALYRSEHKGAYPPDDFRDPAWQRWRAGKLNTFARSLYLRVKTIKPDVLVTWAPSILPWAYEEYLQDWHTWLRDGYADLIIPQCYRYDMPAYQKVINAIHPDSLHIDPAQIDLIYPGILINVGDYRISWPFLEESIRYNRSMGFAGEVFFFYEGIRKNKDELAKNLLRTFYNKKAIRPFKSAR